MNHWVEKFNERPLSHKIIIWVLTLAGVTAAFWFSFYSSRLKERDELSEKIGSLRVEIVSERRLAQSLAKFETEVRDLDEKLAVALKRLPDKGEVPEFLASLQGRATDIGLAVSRFNQMPPRKKEFFEEFPVEVAVDGSFHDVVTFFDEVARLPRIVNINGIVLKQPVVEEDGVRVRVEFSATTFRYIDEEERALAEKEEADARKKKAKRKRE